MGIVHTTFSHSHENTQKLISRYAANGCRMQWETATDEHRRRTMRATIESKISTGCSIYICIYLADSLSLLHNRQHTFYVWCKSTYRLSPPHAFVTLHTIFIAQQCFWATHSSLFLCPPPFLLVTVCVSSKFETVCSLVYVIFRQKKRVIAVTSMAV